MYHIRVDSVAKRSTVLSSMIRNVFVFVVIYKASILQTKIGVVLVGLKVGNTLNSKHHVRYKFVQFAMLFFWSQWRRLSSQRRAGGGGGVGVLLMSYTNKECRMFILDLMNSFIFIKKATSQRWSYLNFKKVIKTRNFICRLYLQNDLV